MTGLRVVSCTHLPTNPDTDTVYELIPIHPDPAFYRERTDRNRGWITTAEQDLLQHAVVGIAGCGGMGGMLAAQFTRLGIGTVRIADCETFDVSNINRQFGATRATVGVSKAVVTAQQTRAVTDDATLTVYPQGITEQTVDAFVAGCAVILDEIELLALDARLLLHARARALGVPILNCNTVGFSTNLFLYTPTGMSLEEVIGIDYDTAVHLCAAARAGDQAAHERIATACIHGLIPTIPEYEPGAAMGSRSRFWQRVLTEKKAPIIATNPVFAAGFLANRTLLHLLECSDVRRDIVALPAMPGYLHIDAATMTARVHTGTWK